MDSDKEVICGSTDSNENDGPMVNGLKNLVDRKVESVDISIPFFDLSLKFDGPLWLKIFCDQTNTDEYENYLFFTPDKTYTVEARSVLTCEERKKQD